ncbi:MAG: TM2 domain-containing protein [Planctomycetota bacterium]|jgi:TM2 domain-containing membrane protein YozV
MDPSIPQPDSDASTIYCNQCGGAMRVAPDHIHTELACPHCGSAVEPWRVIEDGNKPPASTPPHGAGAGHAAATPPVAPPPPQGGRIPTDLPVGQYGVSSRSKVVAGLLGIFLGGLGVHRFYLGHIMIGVIQLILTCVTCGYASIWGFVEGILCFTGHLRDVDGLPLRD